MDYKGYRLKEKGWFNYVVMYDRYDSCIGATHSIDQAKLWIDHVEGLKINAQNYQAQT